jgi:hypothetical protein
MKTFLKRFIIISFLDDLIFQFHVSPFEDYASITLLHKKSDLYLINLGIENVNKIDRKDDTLIIYKYNLLDPFLCVRVKPTISFTHSI